MIFEVLAMAMVQSPLLDMKSDMSKVSAEDAIGLFKNVCFDNFPDSAATLAEISKQELALVKQPKTGSQAMQPGDSWFSKSARVTFVNAEWLPRDLPSPQCAITSILSASPVHSEIASSLATTLSLPEGKIGKDSPRSQSRWDMPGVGVDKWRIFLTTQVTPSGPEITISLLNLRGKKKK